MNKQFILSVVVLFIASMLLGFIIHGTLLKPDYDRTSLMRSEEQQMRHMPAMMVAHVLVAIGMTAIYRRGRESVRPWPGQGVRFGILWAIAVSIPIFLIYYAVQPMPLSLTIKQIIYESIASVLLGITVAAVNK